MNYQTLSLLSFILLGICAILLVVSVLLFIRFRIVSIIGDLTGRTARKQIERSRNSNEKSGNKIHKPNAFNLDRGTITEIVSKGKSGKIGKTGTSNVSNAEAHLSKKLDKTDTATTGNEAYQDNPTDVLENSKTTEVLSNATEVLLDENSAMILSNNDTEVLSDDNGTTILNQTEKLDEELQTAVEFKIVKDIICVHTTEVI